MCVHYTTQVDADIYKLTRSTHALQKTRYEMMHRCATYNHSSLSCIHCGHAQSVSHVPHSSFAIWKALESFRRLQKTVQTNPSPSTTTSSSTGSLSIHKGFVHFFCSSTSLHYLHTLYLCTSSIITYNLVLIVSILILSCLSNRPIEMSICPRYYTL